LLAVLKSGTEVEEHVTEITEMGVSVISVTPFAPHQSIASLDLPYEDGRPTASFMTSFSVR
jgi:hypothetical protein